jgi:hypothetical protein
MVPDSWGRGGGIKFWECDPEAETLRHRTIADAIDAMLEDGDGPRPETVRVYGYVPESIGSISWARPLESVLEELDDEYGGEDPTDPTPAMIAAEAAFLAVIAAEYTVWRCEHVETITATIADYLPGDPAIPEGMISIDQATALLGLVGNPTVHWRLGTQISEVWKRKGGEPHRAILPKTDPNALVKAGHSKRIYPRRFLLEQVARLHFETSSQGELWPVDLSGEEPW